MQWLLCWHQWIAQLRDESTSYISVNALRGGKSTKIVFFAAWSAIE